MDKSEAQRLADALHQQRPEIIAQAKFNPMTQAYEVEVNGGDPRGVRLWLDSPRKVLRYIAWLPPRQAAS